MPPVPCKATVDEIKQLTHDVREVAFRLQEPAELPFTAGQYIGFKVPSPEKPKPVSRLYSIGSAPAEAGIIRVVYNYVGGPGTTFLQRLEVGQPVEFKGPYGQFVLTEDSSRDILLVATGTGVVPFVSMAREYFSRGFDRRVTLLWGVRERRDLYYQEELAQLDAAHKNFRFLMTLSQPDAEWTGLRGRVTTHFPEFFPQVDNLEVYACGSDAMIQDVKQLCEDRGGCPFHREKYF